MEISVTRNLFDLLNELKKNEISKKEYRTRVNHFLEMKARHFKVPFRGTFELTPLCNLDCKMCYIHLQREQITKTSIIPVSSWKELIKEAHRAGMIKANLTGGECLTHPDFDELYLFLYRLGIRIGILSNGYLFDDKRIDFFRKYPPHNIQISLYGGSEHEYENVTGHRCFSVVYNNILKLRDAGFNVFVSITPNNYMDKDFTSLVNTAESLCVPYGINSKLLHPRNDTGREKHDLTIDQYVELYKIQKYINNEDLTPIDPTELPDENIDGSNTVRYGLRCGAGRSSFVIKYNGEMCLCTGLDEYTTHPLKIGFMAAWNELNQMAERFIMPSECDGCSYRSICIVCPAMHKEAATGHCDPVICKRTKQLIINGLLKNPACENNKL